MNHLIPNKYPITLKKNNQTAAIKGLLKKKKNLYSFAGTHLNFHSNYLQSEVCLYELNLLFQWMAVHVYSFILSLLCQAKRLAKN